MGSQSTGSEPANAVENGIGTLRPRKRFGLLIVHLDECRWGNSTPVARFAAPRTEAGARRGGRHGFAARGGEHVLGAPDASSWAKAAALAALAEVGGGGGFGSKVPVVADRAARKLSARALGRSLRTQMRQDLLFGPSFNLYRLRHRHLFLSY
jgi:hypothetical protein